jgi:hypothetical protein
MRAAERPEVGVLPYLAVGTPPACGGEASNQPTPDDDAARPRAEKKSGNPERDIPASRQQTLRIRL